MNPRRLRDTTMPLTDPRCDRRKALRWAAAAASALQLPVAGAARAAEDAPRIRFLAPAEAAQALRDAGDTYYADMKLREIRMRMNSPMTGVSLDDARTVVRDFDIGAALAFTDEERAAIRHVLTLAQPQLAARAPLYARTPWSLIKLDDRAEFGFAHTRGAHIVLPASNVAGIVRHHRAVLARDLASAVRAPGAGLLVHEQTHVLQRASPARFESLYTDVMGFVHATPAPITPWLDDRIIRNPDAPDLGWVMPLAKLGGTGWVMPLLAVRDVDVPRLETDFRAIGADVAPSAAGWTVPQDGDRPRLRNLSDVPGYAAHFPFVDEYFHPNEIAAVALAHWILQDVPDINERPLMPGVAGWAKTALA